MSIQITIQVPSGAISSLRSRWHQQVDSARAQLVQTALSGALSEVIDTVPVETGRTRDEWQSELARVQSSLPSSGASNTSQQAATNAVPQVVYIEYGTTRMPPRSTVRNALAHLQSRIQSLFHLS